jgi:CBS domain-containing protein
MRLRRETYAGGKRGGNERKGGKRRLKKGTVMDIATTEVVTTPLTSTIMGVLKMMVACSFRRVPVVDPGTKRLEGIITGTDLINFFGGGEKHRIVEERYNNNLLAAINEDVREIMERNVTVLEFTSDWEEALEIMLDKNVGGCPVVDREDRIVGIVTERDMLTFLASQTKFDGNVEDFMTRGIVCVKPDTSIEDAMKLIISRRIRRLPVVEDGILLGMVTSSTLLRYFGSGEAFRMLVTGDVDDILRRPIKILVSDENVVEYKELLTFPPSEKISKIARAMIDKNHGAALIMGNGLEGLITERDLVDFLFRAMKK